MKLPLVLLSGLLSNAVLWQHQIRHLSDVASIQVISSVENTPEKMIQGILDKAPPKFALAGHSMGGWLALEIMRAAPSRVSKLCLLNTTARMDSEEKRNTRKQMIQKAKNGQFLEIVKEVVEKFVFNPNVKEDAEKMFLAVGKEVFIHQEQAMLARTECLSILPTITCPTQVIYSSRDKVFSMEEHQELVSQIQNAQIAIVDQAGHMSPIEKPEAITSLLRFWLTDF